MPWIRLLRALAVGLVVLGAAGCHGVGVGEADRHVGVRFPPEPYPARVVYLGPLCERYRVNRPIHPVIRALTGRGEVPPGHLPRPLALAVRDGQVVVCDSAERAVMVIDPTTGTVRPLIHSGQAQPANPVAVAVGTDGRVYVADATAGRVLVVASDGTVDRIIGSPPDASFKPMGLACDGDTLFAANGAEHRVERFSVETGQWLASMGTRGRGPDELDLPVAVAVGPDGRVYVVDMFNARVAMFGRDGEWLGQIGEPGDHPGQFARPRGVAVGSDGVVYVTDVATQVVQMFDLEGRLLMHFGGGGDGSASMVLPAGVCVDRSLLAVYRDRMPEGFVAEQIILVANQYGGRDIGVYAFGAFEQGSL